MNSTNSSFVEFGLSETYLSFRAEGSATKFIDGGKAKREQFIHRVSLIKLLPRQKYCKIIYRFL